MLNALQRGTAAPSVQIALCGIDFSDEVPVAQIVVSSDSAPELVQELQHYLGLRLSASLLPLSGRLDAPTERALAAYRAANWLPTHMRRASALRGEVRALTPMTGLCDLTTWNALHETEAFCVRHQVTLVHQHEDITGCEMASLAMLLGHTAELERPLHAHEAEPWTMRAIAPHGGDGAGTWHEDFARGAVGLLTGDDDGHARLAERLGLRHIAHSSTTPEDLAHTLRQGPLMVGSRWHAPATPGGEAPASGSHAWVLAGMRGDGTPAGTTCLRYDPAHGPYGGVQSWVFDDLVAQFWAPFRMLVQGPPHLIAR
jgi:hypothetical protein